MAGDWLPIDLTLPDKPEVWGLSERLGLSTDEVVGKLIRVWIWANQNLADGHAKSVTRFAIGHVSGVTDFAEAMVAEEWLVVENDQLTFPNWDRWNSENAKKRLRATVRKQNQRSADVTQMSQKKCDKNATRGKGRGREEKGAALRCAVADAMRKWGATEFDSADEKLQAFWRLIGQRRKPSPADRDIVRKGVCLEVAGVIPEGSMKQIAERAKGKSRRYAYVMSAVQGKLADAGEPVPSAVLSSFKIPSRNGRGPPVVEDGEAETKI